MKTKAYRISKWLVYALFLLLSSCGKNEFRIDFDLPKDHIGNYLITYYASNSKGGTWLESTASIQEGVASLDCGTYNPSLVYITDASSPSNHIVLYAEKGDKIKLSGENSDMWTWTVTGNKVSQRWNDWRKEAVKNKNNAKVLEKDIERYVKKNPSDKLSAILLLTEWNRRENPEGFLRLWNTIDEGARSRKIIEICGATDLLGTQFATDADGKLEMQKKSGFKQITLRSRDNGTDTLRFGKAKASLLYFFGENNSERQTAADSIKEVAKAYPDSAKRIIADIYLDSDSMTWVNFIRRDSIEKAVRAWNPYGLADENMAKLGVVRLPWFIVKDKTGKDRYSGDDLKKAMAAFRKEMGKPAAAAIKEVKAATEDNKDKPIKGDKATKEPLAPLKMDKANRNKLKPMTAPHKTIKK